MSVHCQKSITSIIAEVVVDAGVKSVDDDPVALYKCVRVRLMF